MSWRIKDKCHFQGAYAIFHDQGIGTNVDKDRLLDYFQQVVNSSVFPLESVLE